MSASQKEHGEFRLLEADGSEVARTEGLIADAFQEIMHYRFMYEQDGPTKIEQRVAGKWLHVSGIGPVMTLSGSTV